jgi:hypothetical protein
VTPYSEIIHLINALVLTGLANFRVVGKYRIPLERA